MAEPTPTPAAAAEQDVKMDETEATQATPVPPATSAGIASRKHAAKERQARQKYDQSEYTPELDENGQPLPKSQRQPKRKVAVMIGYCGTGYNGLQIQPDPATKTIERDLYDAMHRAGAISRENALDLKKSGFQRTARTDKGVHAAGNVVSLKMIIEDAQIKDKINSHLPEQIRVWGIQRTTKGFDCRKMCSSRVYEYLLPCYSLLKPRPGTRLSSLIREAQREHPREMFMDDGGEGDAWWGGVQSELLQSGITPAQLESMSSLIDEESSESLDSSDPIWRKVKQIENQARRSYRISHHRLEAFKLAMAQYQGTHNFHNFTVGKPHHDTSARRYIISTDVSDPFVIDGTQWVSIKIHGQSFMLHQIRKMICMAALVVRCSLPPAKVIPMCFQNAKINIPKAPALGLLLENPVFDAYNVKLKDNAYDAIDFGKYHEEMLAFKMRHIYDKIYADEVKDNTFYSFFGYIDNWRLPDTEDARGNVTTIFDFLHNYLESAENDDAEPVEGNTVDGNTVDGKEDEKKD
ncbi:uncharacterized protein LODBEIA_P41410 [Lodderomyces beijingensis]|uniref:Pseudouridine synthase I TruA alpha/beta domain-containing protein n=1 Tax=Lodderomyces beijingensis TaxID=1775926 RepID=A0ABP0ZUF4_9ASCO